MNDIYSPALAVALAGAVVALVLVVDLRLAVIPLRPHWVPRLRAVARRMAWIGLVALLVSLTSHVMLGHAPGTAMALGPVDFVRVHPLMPLVALMAIVALFMARRRT